MKKPDREKTAPPKWPVRIVVMLTAALLLLIIGGGWFVRNNYQQEYDKARAHLWAIARLKAEQIIEWRTERQADAGVLMTQGDLATEAAVFFGSPAETSTGAIVRRLEPVKNQYDYEDILLVDAQNRVRFSVKQQKALPDLCACYPAVLKRAISQQKPAWMPFHTGSDFARPHLSLVAPLFDRQNGQKFVGAVVLVVQADRFLFPLIQSWPVPRQSAETLLVRKDGRDVLFLNELRHEKNTALRLRIPVSRTDLPAAMAVSGVQEVVAGRDYRGKKVLAAIMAVPDSPWFIVAKTDAAEIFADWRSETMLILGFILVSAALILAIGLILRQQLLRTFFERLYRSENTLNQALEQYRITLESIGDAVIVTDTEGRVTLLNPVAEKLTGWENPAAVGQSINHVFHIINEQTREPVATPITRVLDEGVVVGLANHTLLLSKDGRETPIADSGAPIRDQNGQITGVVLVFRDQTEERDFQNRLTESEEKFRLLSENSLDAIWTMTPELSFTYISPAIQTITGLPPEQWIGSRLSAHCDNKNLAAITAMIDQTTARGMKNPDFHLEAELLDSRGEKFPVEIHGRVLYADSGRYDLIQGVFHDISERKKAEAVRHYQHHLLTEIGEIARIGGWEVDVRTRRVTWTDQTYAIHEVPRDYQPDLKEAINFFHPEDRPRLEAAIEAALENGRPYDMKLRFITANNRQLWTHTRCVPVLENGRTVKLMGFFQDITEQVNTENDRRELEAKVRQSQKMESIGRLAGGVAHDLNNMLTPVLGHTELIISEAEANEDILETMRDIHEAAVRARLMVTQLLAFSRKQTLQIEVLDINLTIEGIGKLLQKTIREDIRINYAPAGDLSVIRADKGQIEQVVMNLVINAQDAMPHGGDIDIETKNVVLDENYISSRMNIVPGPYVMLAISDTGIGMDEETKINLFEPFYTTKEIGRGTGLGLATTYGIVKQHKGDIWVYSEPGKGSTFKLFFPAAPGEKTAPVLKPDRKDIGGTETIVIAEDEEKVRKIAVRILASKGYRILSMESCRKCLDFLETYQGQPDLLLTDVIMPDMNGRELYETVAKRFPDIKVLYMSGYTDNVIAHHGILDDRVRFLQKPFTVSDLTAKVRQTLDEK